MEDKKLQLFKSELFSKHLPALQNIHESLKDDKFLSMYERIITLSYMHQFPNNITNKRFIEYIETCLKWNRSFLDYFLKSDNISNSLEYLIVNHGTDVFSEEYIKIAQTRLNNRSS